MSRSLSLIIAMMVAVSTNACREAAPVAKPAAIGTPYRMSDAEVVEAFVRASAGNREATARLAFHFGLNGNRQIADYYFEKCLQMGEPDCLADKASGLLGNSMLPNNDDALRRSILLDAKELTTLAIANAYHQRPLRLPGYRFQLKCIEEELQRTRETRQGSDICPETARSHYGQ